MARRQAAPSAAREAQRAMEAALDKYEQIRAGLRRLEARREEIATRDVIDESRRLRFLRRIDQDIAQSREALIVAEADLELARAEALAQAYAERGGD